MNSREKFLAVMGFEAEAPILKTEFGYWAGAIRRWHTEGLPCIEEVPANALDGDLVRGSVPFGCESAILTRTGTSELVDRDVMPYFGLDSYIAKFPIDFSPRLPKKILHEDHHQRIFTDSYGLTVKVLKDGAAAPHFLDYPIKSTEDFHRYISRYDKDYEGRFPASLATLKAALHDRQYPIRLGGGPFGFSYFARSLMGEVGYLTALYDDPGLIHAFNEFFLGFAQEYLSPILDALDIDCVLLLEDIAYRNGPMISKEMFSQFVIPYTVRFVDFVKQFGIRNVFVDCDGKIEDLVPLWVEAGVTGLFPIEAVTDIHRIREAFPRLQLMGGVDKRPLIHGGRKEIDDELERVCSLLPLGGFVPHIDHAVPQDVSWENFSYYRTRLNTIIDQEEW